MPIKNPKELFVTILSQVRQGTGRRRRSGRTGRESGNTRGPPKHELSCLEQTLAKLDQAFKIIGEKPMKRPDGYMMCLWKISAKNLRRSSRRRQGGSSYWQRPIT